MLSVSKLLVSQVCGVLIEIEDGVLFVGIGCNVLSAPDVAALGLNGARPATCLAHHNLEIQAAAESLHVLTEVDANGSTTVTDHGAAGDVDLPSSSGSQLQEGDFHKALAMDICSAVSSWVEAQSDSAALVLQDFDRNLDRSPQRLRDSQNSAVAGGEEVLPIGLNQDGTLQVS